MGPKTRKTTQKKHEGQESASDSKAPATKGKSKDSNGAKEVKERTSRRLSSRFSEEADSSTPNTKRKITSTVPQGAPNASSSVSKKLKSNPIVTEQDIIKSNNSQELVEFINSLVNTKQDEVFTKYQQKVQSQLESDHELIEELNSTVIEKQAIIDNLIKELEEAKKVKYPKLLSTNSTVLDINDTNGTKDQVYQSPIRKKKVKRIDGMDTEESSSHLINQDQLSKELENIGFTLDMLELLTGLRITNFQEDGTRYYFDVKQTSTSSNSSTESIFINYRLVISKTFESTAEINYIPTFLEALEDDFEQDEDDSILEIDLIRNANYLKRILPEYLCENLSFPYNTLSQFYGKVNRALNKRARN
ncbi:uncharacterized protein CANTADRAFT_25507 [Suhomyces tanzawaensis NRRL Y-17324]|uniref:Monopolin complex subunit Csm1/Pcs1 C-terminal domain-containing protein n=1 Tax=Suhomyces tanzawaensis NRRL Y-17324 TaxID=984487 RepID=A0A1E4SJ46_9ASCO|nr:uncharacterized protein CANTADRAFT_25507 [Suhomyces tanzawaensis NRRL Y-17324]ODV79535.1 hypothetical protein CANTADRAFT_25507 [Suhomyces tanzawaensis NRRL Y-17324]